MRVSTCQGLLSNCYETYTIVNIKEEYWPILSHFDSLYLSPRLGRLFEEPNLERKIVPEHSL